MLFRSISYNGLDSKEKNLFLDIACFFKGKNKGWVANILQTSIEIDVLVEKSLIEVSRFGNLWIHDTLQDFGREIVRRESPDEHGQHSRLWLSDDIFHVLKHNTVSSLYQFLGFLILYIWAIQLSVSYLTVCLFSLSLSFVTREQKKLKAYSLAHLL